MDEDRTLPTLADIARIAASAPDLERFARPMLEVLEHVTGFESTYVTVLHWDDFKQEVRYSHNAGALDISEGVFVEWSDTLCRRALLEDRFATDDVPGIWGDSDAAREMGIVSYVSVPIVTNDGSTFGTLCAASTRSELLRADAASVMELFARLVADQVMRERQAAVERERVAAAEAHGRARALAIASAEHKVKTPLMILQGAAAQLRVGGDLPEDVRNSLFDAIERQSVALTSCIEEMLQHTQPDRDAPPLAVAAFTLEPELVRIVRDMRLAAGGHRITVSCADRLSCVANATALAHVLGHVIDNAIKYSPAGEDIDVSAERADDGAVAITVLDRGPGLPSGDLFRPFERGLTSDGIDGSGLGLYIVRSLLESMSGTVEATNAPDGGAVIRIVLPAG